MYGIFDDRGSILSISSGLCSSFEQLPINEQRILLEPALTGIYAESCAQRLKNSPIDEVRERAHKAFP